MQMDGIAGSLCDKGSAPAGQGRKGGNKYR